jgi:hypothetical protein
MSRSLGNSSLRERWIAVGSVQADYYVQLGNCGYPGGLLMNWRGRIMFGQPFSFTRWSYLLNAVKHRLRCARLEVVALATDITVPRKNPITCSYATHLLALVRRQTGTRVTRPAETFNL